MNSDSNNSMPSVYLIKRVAEQYRLYLGQFSTLQGFRLLNPECSLQITEFTEGTTAPEESLERVRGLRTVAGAVKFFSNEANHIEMIDMSCLVDEKTSLSTHDDGECHFLFPDVDMLTGVLRQCVPPEGLDQLLSQLRSNEGKYLSVDENHAVRAFKSFDEYLACHRRQD